MLLANFGLSDEGWSSLGEFLLGGAAVIAGIWTFFNYFRLRREDAARWLQHVFHDFYLSDQFKETRLLLEYDFPERAAPLLERRLTDRHIAVSSEELELLTNLDNLLNYFQHVIYLHQARVFKRRDREAVFQYWFEIMNAPERASLRRYVNRFGFERVADVLQVHQPEYVAVYGSLRRGFALPDLPSEVAGMLVDRAQCKIEGQLIDLGDYPGLIRGDGTVVGELYEVTDWKVFRLLDEYERYDARDRSSSLYIRRTVRLHSPPVDAWIYYYNRDDAASRPVVSSGDWAEYSQRRTVRPSSRGL